MNNKMRGAITVVLMLIASVVQAKDISIYQRTDEFKGKTIYFTEPQRPTLEGGSFISMRYVYFNLVALSPIVDSSVAYSIKVDASLQDWMFIKDGESLVLKADEQIISLSGLGSASDRQVSSMGVQEVAYWTFPLETLKKLAAAKIIKFRVYGSQGQLTGTFTDRMMQELRFFAQEAPALIKDPAATAEPVAASASDAAVVTIPATSSPATTPSKP